MKNATPEEYADRERDYRKHEPLSVAQAFRAAQEACDAFGAAVMAHGYKSRIDWDANPSLKAARDRHYRAAWRWTRLLNGRE